MNNNNPIFDTLFIEKKEDLEKIHPRVQQQIVFSQLPNMIFNIWFRENSYIYVYKISTSKYGHKYVNYNYLCQPSSIGNWKSMDDIYNAIINKDYLLDEEGV
jgi:hypothetical protein